MTQNQLFRQALHLPEFWLVDGIEFCNESTTSLHVWIKYEKAQYFDTESGKSYPIQDQIEVTRRYHDFLNHTCYLHCFLPRYTNDCNQICLAGLPVLKNQLT